MSRVLVVLGVLVLVAAIAAPADATNVGAVRAYTPPGVFPSLVFAYPDGQEDLGPVDVCCVLLLWHGTWNGYPAQLTVEDLGFGDFGGTHTFVLHGRRSATLSWYADRHACLRSDWNSTTPLPGADPVTGCVEGTLDISLTWTRIDPRYEPAIVSGHVTFGGTSLIDPATLTGSYGFLVNFQPD